CRGCRGLLVTPGEAQHRDERATDKGRRMEESSGKRSAFHLPSRKRAGVRILSAPSCARTSVAVGRRREGGDEAVLAQHVSPAISPATKGSESDRRPGREPCRTSHPSTTSACFPRPQARGLAGRGNGCDDQAMSNPTAPRDL